jgi:hypothetical protein
MLVHQTVSVQLVNEDTYLGDVIRASKGIGIVSQIMNILDTISFGKCYYQIAFSLREAMFLNGILTNADIWYCVTKSDIEELELADTLLLRRTCPSQSPLALKHCTWNLAAWTFQQLLKEGGFLIYTIW